MLPRIVNLIILNYKELCKVEVKVIDYSDMAKKVGFFRTFFVDIQCFILLNPEN
jgi:hypothetical protein